MFRRAGGFTVYMEGWGLYAETLGHELGLYKDPYSRFGFLHEPGLGAARLVVDTGIHAKGWTRQQAIDYMIERDRHGAHTRRVGGRPLHLRPGTGADLHDRPAEVHRAARESDGALGARFDIRRFHMAVLDQGRLPLDLLERVVDEWIAAEQTRG